MTIDEERLLLLKIKRDLRNFGILFDTYYSPIFNYICRRVAEYDVSRDIASETFLKAYLNINSLSIAHFYWDNINKELLIAIKFKLFNIIIILISICIVLVFLYYVAYENIYEQVIKIPV